MNPSDYQHFDLGQKTHRFHKLFLLVTSVCTALGAFIVIFLHIFYTRASGILTLLVVFMALGSAISAAFTFRNMVRTGAYTYIISLFVGVVFAAILGASSTTLVLGCLLGTSMIGALMIRPSISLYIGCLGSVVIFLARFMPYAPDQPILQTSGAIIVLVILSIILFLFAREARDNLSVLRRRVEHNTQLFQELPGAAYRLGAAAEEIFSMTEQQTRGSIQQASAVTETREALRSFKRSSGEIVASAEEALQNAQTTLDNNEKVSQDIVVLSGYTQDIFGLLDVIKDIADKTDLLALNAALEGTKAGEAGRGFTLVASQMQRLAENVAESATDIKELTASIRQATDTTQLSMEEATKLAQASTEAAQKISLITQQQKSSVEQVTGAMEDIGSITSMVAAGTEQTVTSTEQLKELAQKMTNLVEKFQASIQQ